MRCVTSVMTRFLELKFHITPRFPRKRMRQRSPTINTSNIQTIGVRLVCSMKNSLILTKLSNFRFVSERQTLDYLLR